MVSAPPRGFGRKSYPSIPHLPGSRAGSDRILGNDLVYRLTKKSNQGDWVYVQEKLDGSCVAVVRQDDALIPIGRSGWLASSSRFEQHWQFSNWVYENAVRFLELLDEGERVVGEWLMQAHGTRYVLVHDPFVPIDLMRIDERANPDEVRDRCERIGLESPKLLHVGGACSVSRAMSLLGERGFHGAIDRVEGAVWRLVSEGYGPHRVECVAKYVRHDKEDGKYLPGAPGEKPIWNWHPTQGGGHEGRDEGSHDHRGARIPPEGL